ncbi:MAG: Flp pilus assembly protein CpaB [Sandarakinorhabdus sp.]|nr:Flp pilus assembly protein CpaB [Sandarakinorhabdus sp.]
MIRARPTRWALNRTGVRLALAIGLALAAETRTSVVDVLITARPIEAGTSLGAADLRWQQWPAQLAGRGWLVRGPAAASAPLPMVGRVVQVRLAAGVPITAAMAIAPAKGSTFAAAIRPGWRAASIAVTPAAGLAGFVAPGDRVDLLLTQTLGNRRTVQTMLTDLGVLGVDQRQRGSRGTDAPLAAAGDVVAGASGAEPPNLITLEVTSRQAEAIAVAAELGKLSLVLRGPGRDPAVAGSRRWDSDVTGLSPAQLAAGSNSGDGFSRSILAVPAAAAASYSPVASAPSPQGHRGVEIVYGAPAASEPEATK